MSATKPPREAVVKKLRAVAKQQNRVHVISSNGGWAVKREGLSRASRVVREKDEAIQVARSIAQERSLAVIVHARDGSVQEAENLRQP